MGERSKIKLSQGERNKLLSLIRGAVLSKKHIIPMLVLSLLF